MTNIEKQKETKIQDFLQNSLKIENRLHNCSHTSPKTTDHSKETQNKRRATTNDQSAFLRGIS